MIERHLTPFNIGITLFLFGLAIAYPAPSIIGLMLISFAVGRGD